MTNGLLQVEGLVKRFGALVAVDGLSLQVRQGEVLGFLGPNGAGKTTSLRMMCGLLRPDAGSIVLDGVPIVAGTRRGLDAIGVAPQELVIWDTLTCREQLEFCAGLYDVPRPIARDRTRALLAALGLEEKADRLARTLSGGMQRRLNIALALVHEPKLVFLDEPQAGLDPQSRVLVRDYLQSLRGRITVVLTTHDMEEAEKLADRVCIVDRGRLLALDSVDAIRRSGGGAEVVEITLADDAHAAIAALPAELVAACTPGDRADTICVPTQGPVGEVLQALARRGLGLSRLRTRDTTLEDAFLRLTGRRLRE